MHRKSNRREHRAVLGSQRKGCSLIPANRLSLCSLLRVMFQVNAPRFRPMVKPR